MKVEDRRLLSAAVGQAAPPQTIQAHDLADLGGLFHVRGYGEGVFGAHYLRTAASNLQQLSAVRRLCDDLAAVGAEPLVLPGAALLRLYPDIGCRPMDDVDLLVPPGQRDLVVAALVENGWHAPERHPDLFIGDDGCSIDLHTDLLNCDRLPARRRAGWIEPAAAWSRRQRRDVGGFSFLTLSDEDEVLLTAAHAMRHSYRRLAWLVDLALQVRQPHIDPDRLWSDATSTGLNTSLIYALTLLARVPVEVPSWAARWCIQHEPGTLVTRALHWIHRHRRQTVGGELLSCWTCRRRSDRLRLLTEFVFPGRAVLLQVYPRLPSSLVSLAYPLRLLQVVGRSVAELALAARRR